jgi:pimeloyl-ACP methyl ester carboxylesterase
MVTLIASQYRHGIPVVFRTASPQFRAEAVSVLAADGARSHGLYWTHAAHPRPSTALLFMHPHVDFTRHYAIPRLLEAGYACLGANSRSPNNDFATVHEQIILDVHAHLQFLRRQPGIAQVVLVGNSGGGSLMALYQAQAQTAPARRLKQTPGGRSLRLAETDMPPADGIVFLSAHRGEGHVMTQVIDPAVVDEGNPWLTDAALDMYSAANGFREPPAWTEYSDAFIARYREAQLQRVARIDRLAHAMIRASHRAAQQIRQDGFAQLPQDERRDAWRAQVHQPVMVVNRTMANPAYADPRFDRSPRGYGSLMSPRPDIMNFDLRGFARVTTPHAWLSTWSGLSTNADLARTGPAITVPALVVHAECDQEVYEHTDARAIFGALASHDKELQVVPGARHYFEAGEAGEDTHALDSAMDVLVGWLSSRFPP